MDSEKNIYNIDTESGGFFHWTNLLVFVYNIDFLANSKVDVSVQYRTKGGRDELKTVENRYTFDYLLNPAKKWSTFKDLTINVKPPAQAPYIIDSSVKFTKNQDGYTAFLEKLPDEDLYFQLYSKPTITLLESYLSHMNNEYSYFSGIVLLFQILLLIALPMLAVIFVKKIILTIKEGR